MKEFENVEFNGQRLAVILRSSYDKNGIKFFTPNNFSQQLGYMKHPKGHIIAPHVHNPLTREVTYTKEVLFIKSGKIRVDFYNEKKKYLESRILNKGDVILLAFGGHGFEMLEPTEMIEVKQGPYSGDMDKSRFQTVDRDKLKVKN